MSNPYEKSYQSLSRARQIRFHSAVQEHAARKALGKTPTDVQTRLRTDTERITIAGKPWLRRWRGNGTYALVPCSV